MTSGEEVTTVLFIALSILNFGSDAKNYCVTIDRLHIAVSRQPLCLFGHILNTRPGRTEGTQVQPFINLGLLYRFHREAEMKCQCGCGETPARGKFSPGHDQRLRISLEKRVGGLAALRVLVESAERVAAGEISADEHAGSVRGILNRGGG